MPRKLSVNQGRVISPAITKKATNIRTVDICGDTWICFKQSVGILLAIIMPLKIRKQAATTGFLKHSYSWLLANQKIRGKMLKKPPAGAGTPIKKCFQYGGCLISIKLLNLAKRAAQHMETNKTNPQ